MEVFGGQTTTDFQYRIECLTTNLRYFVFMYWRRVDQLCSFEKKFDSVIDLNEYIISMKREMEYGDVIYLAHMAYPWVEQKDALEHWYELNHILSLGYVEAIMKLDHGIIHTDMTVSMACPWRYDEYDENLEEINGLCWLKLFPIQWRGHAARFLGTSGVKSKRNLMLFPIPLRMRESVICKGEFWCHVDENEGVVSLSDLDLDLPIGQNMGDRVELLESSTIVGGGATLLIDRLTEFVRHIWASYSQAVFPGTLYDVHGYACEWVAGVVDCFVNLSGNALSFLGLQSIIDSGLTCGLIFADIVTGLVSGLHVGLPFVLPVLKIINYCLQDFDQAHGCNRVWEGSKVRRLPFAFRKHEYDLIAAACPFPQFDVRDHFFTIDPCLTNGRNLLKQFSDDNAGQRLLMGIASNEIVQAYNTDNRPRLFLGTDLSETRLPLLQRVFPEFRVKQVAIRHTHSFLKSVRYAYGAIIQNSIRDFHPEKAIKTVGAAGYQMLKFDNIGHNCGPQLSGRDEAREHRMTFQQQEISKKISFNHVHKNCDFAPLGGCVTVCEYATGDMSLYDFIVGMVRTGSRDAYVSIMLPVPMMDKRVDVYRDEINGVLYDKKDGKVFVYNTNAAVAGYCHDYENLLSWCSPVPSIDGLNILVEEYRRVGTNFLLHVQLGFGIQEAQPTMWRVTDEEFYVLPLLTPDWKKEQSVRRNFIVPASRFDNIVHFITAPGTDKAAYDVLCSRTRTQMAEIKLGNQVIEPRWKLSIEEFNSVVGHAILAANVGKWDYELGLGKLKGYFTRMYARHTDNWLWRIKQYYADIFSLQLSRKKDPFEPGLVSRFLDWYCASRMDHGQMWNPYQLAGEYRVVHNVVQRNCDELLRTCKKYLNRMRALNGVQIRSVNCTIDMTVGTLGCDAKRPGDNKLGYLSFRRKGKDKVNINDLDVLNQMMRPQGNMITCPEINIPAIDSNIKPEETPVIESFEQFEVGEPGNPIEVFGEYETDTESVYLPLKEDEFESAVHKGFEGAIGTSHSIEKLELADLTHRVRINTEMRTLFCLPEFRIQDCYSESLFAPDELIAYYNMGISSKCHQLFIKDNPSPALLRANLMAGRKIYAPDIGCTSLVELAVRNSQGKLIDLADHMLGHLGFREQLKRAQEGTLSKRILEFHKSVDYTEAVRAPDIVIDGIAGTAKSSIVRSVIKRMLKKTLIVVPTNTLRNDWEEKVDKNYCQVVSKHGMCVDFDLLVIDEVFSIEGEVLIAWLIRAARNKASVICLGERNQQYEHTLQIGVEFFSNDLGVPLLRMLVSNTMPQDALSLAKEMLVSRDTDFDFCQTRNKIKYSMYWIDDSGPLNPNERWADLEFTETSRNQFVGPLETKLLHGKNLCGISQVQGLRGENVLFHPSLQGTNWFKNTMNLAYVAISRHRRKWVSYFYHDSQELAMFAPLVQTDLVDGVKRHNDPFALDVLQEFLIKDVSNLSHNNEVVTVKERSLNRVGNEFCPEPKLSVEDITLGEVQDFIHSRTFMESAMKEELPQHLRCGPCARSFGMWPKKVIRETARVSFLGAERLAVHQLSSNHWDDQRNVDLRQFDIKQPSDISDLMIRKSNWLFRRFIKSYCKEEFVLKIAEVRTGTWLESRSRQFMAVLNNTQFFGESGRSMNHLCFLKSQDKIKPQENYAAQLQYGQTVIASDPSYNVLFGPHTQKFEKQLQAMLRDDYIIDVGYSDRDLAAIIRQRGLVEILTSDPYQIDVKRQDSSHNAITVLAFCLLLEFIGVPSFIVDIYIHKRSMYKVNSMAACLYAGSLSFKLPSGDPFTLGANIFQMMLTMCERFDMAGVSGITKGDDTLLSRKPENRIGVMIEDMRCVQLECLQNGVAYHAGRFLLPNGNLCYDPVRFVLKVLAKGEGTATNEELNVAIHDRQMWLDLLTIRLLSCQIPMQYSDVNAQAAITILRIADSLKNGDLYWRIVQRSLMIKRKIRFSAETDCAYELAIFLGWDPGIAEQFRECNGWQVYELFVKYSKMPVYYGLEAKRKAWLTGGIVVTPNHALYIF